MEKDATRGRRRFGRQDIVPGLVAVVVVVAVIVVLVVAEEEEERLVETMGVLQSIRSDCALLPLLLLLLLISEHVQARAI